MKSTVAIVLAVMAVFVSSLAMLRDGAALAQPSAQKPDEVDTTVETIKARSIAIVNPNGTVVMRLASDVNGKPEFRMYDEDGAYLRASLGISADGVSSFNLYDKRGNGRVDVFATPGGRAGFRLASGARGDEQELAGLIRDEDAIPMLQLRDTDGMLRLLHMVSGGTASTILFNKSGESRVEHTVDKAGHATLETFNVDGKSVFRLVAGQNASGKGE